ncbi:unnamed protein product [Mytilus edulis]|uniref:exodeoxyribonuclease III n=1 Tax=Mytilus edulis TaxID=6550 RepID=A0A8S3Q1M7_MYTED|nr:unnamed protein product [Mytilus edulis]
MICLLRNLSTISPPSLGYDKLPPATEISDGADLARIKYFRNLIAHPDKDELTTGEFNSMWACVSEAGGLGGQTNRKEQSQRNINKRFYDQRTSMPVIAKQSHAEEIERQKQLQQLTNQADNINQIDKEPTEEAIKYNVDVTPRTGLITTASSGDAPLEADCHQKQRPIKQDKREDIIIGTLNVQNVKSNALYIKNLLRDVHVLCIQEHWLFNAEKKIIAEITENSGYIAKSVDDNDDPDFNISMKRGYGGVAIIWKKEINENIKELIDGGNRIQAIHIQQGDKPICLINVYMPSDSKNADIEYKDTLAQIDEMIEKYKDTHEIIVCGDMNGSLDRSSTPHDKILKTFCKEKCIGNTEKCPVKETFYHQNGMSKGQIDYFLFKSNSEIINKIRQIDVLDTDPENTSDHVPVILTLNSQLKKVREKATTIIAKPKWTDCDHQIYKEVINKDLPKLMQKSKGIIEQDIRNLEKLLHKAGEAAIPKYKKNQNQIKGKGDME